ncbi:MAG: hypothetical protein K2G32_01740 [Oscillospiraceae bacterium]|nr:hypothetical protein [Oscillospiraceae bacterium]
MNNIFDLMKRSVGLEQLKPCTLEENRQFTDTMNKGDTLPDDIVITPYKDSSGNPAKDGNGNYWFFRSEQVAPGKEQLYMLMKIYKDLHFIYSLFVASLIVGIISVFILFIALMSWLHKNTPAQPSGG